MAEGSELVFDNRMDTLIWRHAGVKSARATAEELGIKPEEVLRRRKDLLDSVDDLTIKQAKQKLIADLQGIAQSTKEDYEDAPWEFKSGLMNSSIAAMKAILVELNRADKADEEKVNHLNALRVRELVALIREVVDISVEEIAEKYDLNPDEIYPIFNANMEKAARVRDAITA
jgi:uncharacterized protein (DUF433 family)